MGGTGISVAQAHNDGSGTQATRTAKQGKKRGMRAAHVRALAEKLGVSVERLQAALKAVRPARPAAGQRPARPNLAADLAQALGVEQSKVQEILDANRGPGRPDHSRLISALATGLGLDEASSG